MTSYQRLDQLAIEQALRLNAREHSRQCSGLTGTWAETIFANRVEFTSLDTFTSEASLLAGGTNELPTFPALFFHQKERRHVKVIARGILASTGTPTYLITLRLGTTAGSAYLSGTQVGCTIAMTTGSGVTNQAWHLEFDMICTAPGTGTGNTTLLCAGLFSCPAGLATPFAFNVLPSTPPTATWTQTIDGGLTQYLNISATCSASSSSNAIKAKTLVVYGMN